MLKTKWTSELLFVISFVMHSAQKCWAQLFEGRLALNPGLNLTRVSFSCVLKHFLG